MKYQKLVRDRIPEFIKANGEQPVYRILDNEEYVRCLEQKLDEEVAEYHADKNAEELADILEVLISLAQYLGVSQEELLQICEEKRMARGGFDQRIFLIEKR